VVTAHNPHRPAIESQPKYTASGHLFANTDLERAREQENSPHKRKETITLSRAARISPARNRKHAQQSLRLRRRGGGI